VVRQLRAKGNEFLLHTYMESDTKPGRVGRHRLKLSKGLKAGAYTRPLFSSTLAVFDKKCTLDTP